MYNKGHFHGSPYAMIQPLLEQIGSVSLSKIGVTKVEQQSPQFLAKNSEQHDEVSTSGLDLVSSM